MSMGGEGWVSDVLDAWFRHRSSRPRLAPTHASGTLTAHEVLRLTRWAHAYRAESAFGAVDGKRWAFARYLVETRRLNEDGCIRQRS